MKLGEKLKQTLDELERAKIEGLEKQHQADMEKIRRERADTADWINSLKDLLISQIESGKVPLKKVKNYERKKWVKDAVRGFAANSDLWDELARFWKSEGLEIVVSDAHDGAEESWINITLSVLPPRTRVATASSSKYRVPFENRD